MCGIAGLVSPRVKDPRGEVERMNQTLIHRGPDDSGIFTQGNLGLGMRRLSIIDLVKGHQPMTTEDGRATVVFNGEIYNFRELRAELSGKGYRFRTDSDTEVILRLYEEEGIQCLEKLNGMFGFAIYDQKEDWLFIARDRLGEKPIHYYHQGDDFAFASEIKAILSCSFVTPTLNFEALNLYLTYEYVPAPLTIYQHIYKLEAGHYLLFKAGTVTLKSYWRPSFRRRIPPCNENEAVALLRQHLERSIKMRLESDVPLGAFLSGGVDSSLIVAFLARVIGRKIKTFNISFSESSFNESQYAMEIAKQLGTDHREERLTPEVMRGILPRVIEMLDEPYADGGIVPTFLLSQFTRKSVTVALSGDGSDELFAGYPTYQAHRIARWLPRALGRPAHRWADRLPSSDENISFDFKLRRFTAGLSYPLPERNQIWLGSFDPETKQQLLSRDVLASLNGQETFSGLRAYDALCDSQDDLDRITHLDLRYFLQDDQLFRVDRASMANSLEVRAPYLDHLLVEFVCSLPPRLRLHRLTTKYLLKKAAEGLLPEKIIRRSKKGFGMPIAKWIKGDLKELFLETLSSASFRQSGLFEPRFVERLFQEHLSGRKDHRKWLWTLFVFESWRKLRKPGIGR